MTSIRKSFKLHTLIFFPVLLFYSFLIFILDLTFITPTSPSWNYY